MVIIQSYTFTLANKRKAMPANKKIKVSELRAFVLKMAHRHGVRIGNISLVIKEIKPSKIKNNGKRKRIRKVEKLVLHKKRGKVF